MNHLIASLFMLVFLAACGMGNDSETDTETAADTSASAAAIEHAVDGDEVNRLTSAIIASIPTTQLVEQVIEETEQTYDLALINPLEHAGKYQLSTKMATNLGVYLCDLGYISSFHQPQELILYINAAKKLAEGIGVHELIDEETMENLELNMDNQDSLLTIIRRIYHETYAFLEETNRLSTSALLVGGGWVEGLYLAMQIVDTEAPNEKVLEALKGQYATYQTLQKLLANFSTAETQSLYKNLQRLDTTMQTVGEGTPSKIDLEGLKSDITAIRAELVAVR
jgi:hypothetical protein